jgi:Golgi SNAP receptor complex protein 1
MTDQLLEQAYETRAEFGQQRNAISGINTRMYGVLSMFSSPSTLCVTDNAAAAATMPGINSLLGMIRSRRRRDAIIIGMLLGLGFVVILMYHWG